MDAHKQLLIANGEDKTDSVISYRFENGKCLIRYSNTAKTYSYNAQNVKILTLRKKINTKDLIAVANGRQIAEIEEILDFGDFYRIFIKGKRSLSYRKNEVELLQNCLGDKTIRTLFEYFKKTAESISLVTDEGINILSRQYKTIQSIRDDAVLASYLNAKIAPQKRKINSTLIYPFGLNQSQKLAVENAFSSQVSIIQGPPGTGKTQTILNIIANAVMNKKTVAVVSNNNSATLNVAEKLDKKGVSFIAAFLGSLKNKDRFLNSQSGSYPDMAGWESDGEVQTELSETVKRLSAELDEMFRRKNRIAEIERELSELRPEEHYFNEYYSSVEELPTGGSKILTSQKIMALWADYERRAERQAKLGPFEKLSILLRFDRFALGLYNRSPESVIPYLQNKFYSARKAELVAEREKLETELLNYSFDSKAEELSEKSLKLFKAELSSRYPSSGARRTFCMADFRGDYDAFNKEYPVILSTTYSIKGTLDIDHIYDYLIIDEASQADLATGVLAFSCAKNVIIVGDLKQLPNVITEEDSQAAEAIWQECPFDEIYRFSKHSLLSSATERWRDVPSVLLREHYRCHPEIIGFCNQKFYQNQLIVMTKDRGEKNVLTMYRTAAGNHARGHLNQRQIDVIKKEVLPFLESEGFCDIGIITPYCDQVNALSEQLGDKYEVATVHKFQGREKDAIILTSVDNIIGEFADDPNMLNVAVSRAVKALVVITSCDPKNDNTNYGDLARYIEYNNCEVIDSAVFSVFDLLYKAYAKQRREYLQKHARVSDYDSENLLYSVIENVLEKEEFQKIGCAVHVCLATMIKNYDLLDEDEKIYARNPLTHTDFLLFNVMNKAPVLAIELDGTGFHKSDSKQAARDTMKDGIFKKCGVPLLRIRTNESDERERIENTLRKYI